MIKSKKGEISSETVIYTVIFLLSVIVIFMVVSSINLKGEINRNVCHNSILERHTINIGGQTGGLLPLKCQTEKICFAYDSNIIEETKELFTDDPNECDLFEGEKYKKIKISSEKQAMEEINKLKMEYHSMVGEGYLIYHPSDNYDFKTNYCSPLAIVYFTETFQEKVAKEISYKDMFELMEKTKSTGKEISQLEDLYGVDNFHDFRIQMIEGTIDPNSRDSDLVLNDIAAYKLDTSQTYMMISTLQVQGNKAELLGGATGAAIALGVTMLVPGVGAVFGVFIPVVAGAAGGAFFASKETVVKDKYYYYSPPFLWPYNSESLKQLNCKFDFAQ